MRNYLIHYLILITFFSSYCIESKGQLNNEIASLTPLKIGEKIPDISLGIATNNPTYKKSFSQFKGRLVILDFWTTYCGSCVQSLPHLQELQDEFDGKIQIILVNPIETPEQIEERMKKNILHYKFIHSKNIISLSLSDTLTALFPHNALGYDVWIDKKGVVRLLGNTINNSSGKITAILQDKPFTFLGDDVQYTTREKPLTLNSVNTLDSLAQLTYITGFIPQYGAKGGLVIDSLIYPGTHKRYTFVNRDLLLLFSYSLSDHFKDEWKKRIYSTNFMTLKDYFTLYVTDTLKYSFYFLDGSTKKGKELYNDDSFVKSAYSYEKVVPKKFSEPTIRSLMFEDLRQYFQSLYHTKIEVVKEKIPCYALVRLQNDKGTSFFPSSKDTFTDPATEYMINGYKWLHIKNGTIADLGNMFTNKMFSHDTFVIDQTGYGDSPISFDIPDTPANGENPLNTLEDAKKLLKKYGLDIVETVVEMPKLKITEN